MSADIYEKLQIAISHAKVAPDSFAFLCKQIEAWRATDRAALSQPAAVEGWKLVPVEGLAALPQAVGLSECESTAVLGVAVTCLT